MFQKVTLIGRLGRDPEMRSTPSGQSLAKFSIATDRKWSDRDGNKQQQTEWHNCVAWGRTGEVCGQYLSRGSLVHIEGRLQTDSWEDKDTGKKLYRTEVVVEQMTMIDTRGGEKEERNGDRSGDMPGDIDGRFGDGSSIDDSDIPF